MVGKGWQGVCGCTFYMRNYDEKSEVGMVKCGIKRDGKNYVVVYPANEHDEKLYEWPDWERYALCYDRVAGTSHDRVEW
jgi:hypothetical protein